MVTKVSVVVPTYNRPELAKKCLTALRSQDYPSDRMEVLLVDDGSEREIGNELREFISAIDGDFKYLWGTHGGPGAARNRGIVEARGDIIAFVDDDCEQAVNWISRLVGHFNRPEIGVVYGRILPIGPHHPLAKVISNPNGESYLTGNIAFRRETLEEVGYFDERAPSAVGEDYDIVFRVLDKGWGIDFAFDAVVYHWNQTPSRAEFIEELHRAWYFLDLCKRHRVRIRTHSGRGAYGNILYHLVLAPMHQLLVWRKWFSRNPAMIPEAVVRSMARIFYGLYLIGTLGPSRVGMRPRL